MVIDEKRINTVAECTVHMHINAELNAYWLFYYTVNTFTVFERLHKALFSFHLMLFKVYFLWKYLSSPEKDCVVKFLISHISLFPLVGDVVQEVLHVSDMEFSYLYAVWCTRVIFQFY